MFFDFTVIIPDVKGKIVRKKRADTTYVNYEYDRVYLPEKQYTIPKRTTIGKVCDEDSSLMYPNANYLKFFPDAELPKERDRSWRSSCLRIGPYLVIRKIVQEYKLDEMLERIIGKDAGLFLDLAAYSIICEDNAAQYYPDYAYNHPLFTGDMRIYSDSKVSDFFREITVDQSTSFLNEWNASRDHRERIYISYDSTNKDCQAGDVEMAEIGHSKSGSDKPVINYALAYDRNNREPLFYEDYPGSIVDVSQLQYMLERAQGYGYRRVGFILDRGYFSRENIHFMDRSGYDFVIMVKGKKKLVKEILLKKMGSFEEDRATGIRKYRSNGVTVKHRLFASDEKERYFHLYYSNRKHAAEREQLEAKIDHQAALLKRYEGRPVRIDPSYEKYFELVYHQEEGKPEMFVGARERTAVINEEMKFCGYYCLITSEKMTAKEALLLYKSRDGSEKLFRGDKSYLGDNSMRVYTDESVMSKIFVEFVALIIRGRIYTCLDDASNGAENRPNFMTVPAAIKELEKIEMIRHLDHVYRLDHAVTKKQKIILNAFGIDTNYVKAEAKRISEQLSQSQGKGGPENGEDTENNLD